MAHDSIFDGLDPQVAQAVNDVPPVPPIDPDPGLLAPMAAAPGPTPRPPALPVLGPRPLPAAPPRALQAPGPPLPLRVLRLPTLAQDVPPELAFATIDSLEVLGALQASPAVKAALASRMR